MKDILNFIQMHYDEILAIIGGIVSISSIIVKLTPTTADDEVLNKIITLLEKLSIFNTKENQEKIDCFTNKK